MAIRFSVHKTPQPNNRKGKQQTHARAVSYSTQKIKDLKTKDDFQNAERFTVKADGTWSCEAPEGDMFGGQSGTWSKSDGNTILMDNPEGGTGNKGCSIEFTDPDKGEAELLTQYGKCKMIRTDTECGNIASQLFDQVLGGSQ